MARAAFSSILRERRLARSVRRFAQRLQLQRLGLQRRHSGLHFFLGLFELGRGFLELLGRGLALLGQLRELGGAGAAGMFGSAGATPGAATGLAGELGLGAGYVDYTSSLKADPKKTSELQQLVSPAHPLLALPNALCTPHLGFVEKDNYEAYYGTAFRNIVAFAEGKPQGLVNPEALAKRR